MARWAIPARGAMELQYDAYWLAADVGRPLSLSLPFNLENLPVKGERVANYFDNLLADSDAIRRRVADRFRTGSAEPFDSTAQKVGYASTAEPLIEELLARTPAAIADVHAELPQDFAPRVRDAILGGLEQAARALGGMAP